MIAGGEQTIRMGLRLAVGLAVNQFASCDMIARVQEVAAIAWHNHASSVWQSK
jgi:hypothetical protein